MNCVMFDGAITQWGVRRWKRWVLAGRTHYVPPKEGTLVRVLSHNSRYKVSLTAFCALFVGVYCLAFVWGDAFANAPTWKRLALQYGLLAVAALSCYSITEAFFDRVEITDHGLTVHALLRAPITVQWEEISSLYPISSVNRENVGSDHQRRIEKEDQPVHERLGNFS
jgi:hypothetical protein